MTPEARRDCDDRTAREVRRRRRFAPPLLLGALFLGGCLNLKAPDSIVIGGRPHDDVDSENVPRISTVEEGRTELDKAYRSLRRAEAKARDLERENAKLKRERDEYKGRAEERN